MFRRLDYPTGTNRASGTDTGVKKRFQLVARLTAFRTPCVPSRPAGRELRELNLLAWADLFAVGPCAESSAPSILPRRPP
jgi:hypothetical protein